MLSPRPFVTPVTVLLFASVENDANFVVDDYQLNFTRILTTEASHMVKCY